MCWYIAFWIEFGLLLLIASGVWFIAWGLYKKRKGVNEPPPKEGLKEESKGAEAKPCEESGKSDNNPKKASSSFEKKESENDLNDALKRIGNLEKAVKIVKSKKYSYWGLLLKIFICAVVFFVFAVLLKNYFCFEISGDSVVLAFVGIAATFIVISNYAQVKDAKDEFAKERAQLEAMIEDKIKQAEDKFVIAQTQLKSQIEGPLKALSEDIDSRIEKEKNLMRYIDIQSTESFATSTSRLANIFAEQKNYKEALIYHAMAASAYTKLVNQYNKGDHTGHLKHSINKMLEMVQLMQNGNIPKFDEKGLLDLRFYMMEINDFRLNRVTDFINGIKPTNENTQIPETKS
jgi:ssDNA-binding Zn-finger/Zn-ribbon topoisomerase 1